MFLSTFLELFARKLHLLYIATLFAGLVCLGGTLPTFAATRVPARPASGPTIYFTPAATQSNTIGDSTYIDDPDINGNTDASLVVTADWNPSGIYTGFDNAHVGVWYNPFYKEWAIFNEDLSAMPIGAHFNVYLGWADTVALSETATASNTIGYEMTIDDAWTGDNNPGALDIQVTPNWSPNRILDNHAPGVWYNPFSGRWVVYHEDLSPIQSGETFNFYIEAFDDGSHVAIVTADSSGNACTNIGDPETSPLYYQVFLTHIYTNGYINGVTGVWFNGTQWCVFEDGMFLPTGTEFFVYVFP
jgi:hypothetical protein